MLDKIIKIIETEGITIDVGVPNSVAYNTTYVTDHYYLIEDKTYELSLKWMLKHTKRKGLRFRVQLLDAQYEFGEDYPSKQGMKIIQNSLSFNLKGSDSDESVIQELIENEMSSRCFQDIFAENWEYLMKYDSMEMPDGHRYFIKGDSWDYKESDMVYSLSEPMVILKWYWSYCRKNDKYVYKSTGEECEEIPEFSIFMNGVSLRPTKKQYNYIRDRIMEDNDIEKARQKTKSKNK